MSKDDNDGLFHPLKHRWFAARVGRPTRIQDAVRSPYLDLLRDRFDTISEERAVTVYRRVTP